MLTPAQIAAIAARALEDKKARDVKVLKTTEQTVLADYFVICNGSSSTHIKALVDEVDKQLSEAGEPPIRREGLRSDIWVRPESSTTWSAFGATQRWWISHPFPAPEAEAPGPKGPGLSFDQNGAATDR